MKELGESVEARGYEVYKDRSPLSHQTVKGQRELFLAPSVTSKRA
jgi:hypothetical protein